MQREILFRGKRIYNGKWAYGNLVLDRIGNPHIVEADVVYEDGHHIAIDSDTPMFIDPDTIGQYTGHKDENGMKIFEGDRCKVTVFDPFGADTQYNAEVLWSEGGAFAFCGRNFFMYLKEIGDTESDVEVIGNIWDGEERVDEPNKC